MKKRIISLILALTLCVGMLPAPAWAEEPTDPTQAVEVVGAANPSEETDPTTEPTEEETEPTEEETEPTEEETEPTEETTDPTEEETEPAEVQILEEPVGEVAAFGADSTEDVAMLEADGKTTYYASVNAAIAAATEEKTGTVTLLGDAALENSDGKSYFDHTNQGTDLTIVLDGHTLTGNMEDGSWDAQLTIDGTKSGSTFSGSIKFYGKRNVLTINGGTYQNGAGNCALELWGTSTQLNITAGEFKNRLQFSCEWDSENGGYTPLNVTGGTFCGITYDGNETLTLCRKAPYCFMDGSQKIKLSDLGLTTDRTLTVAECTEHTYETDETQENCEYCGKRNPQKPPENAVATVDGEFYSTLLGAIQAADTSGKTVVLCKDQRLPDDGLLRLDSYTVTIDLNGKELAVQQGLPILVTGGNVTLANSQPTGKIAASGNNGSAIQVQGGSLTVKENVQVEGVSYGGHIYPAIEVSDGTVTLHRGATLVNGIQAPDGHTIAEYLAEGSAYAANGRVTNGYVQGTTDTLTVVEHSSHFFLGGGKCDCGKETTAQLDAGGVRYYFDDFNAAINEAKTHDGSTLTLLRDVTLTGENNLYIASGTFTIDWQGHTLSGEMSNNLLVITYAAKVTLTDSVGTGGLRNVGGAAIGVYSGGSLTIRGGVYSPQLWKDRTAYGPIRISGGRFENPEGAGRVGALFCDTGALADLLAPGYTFAYEDHDSRFYVYGACKPEDYRTVYVVAHTHENWTDGVCDCGYTCPHDQVDKEGVCTDCGKQFYVQGTYENGTTHYYGALSAALGDSAVTKAVIICSFGPVCESWNGGDRSVILDLNGIPVVLESIQGGHLILCDSSGAKTLLGMKEIQKDGQVSVESGRLVPQAETLSVYGKLTVTGGYVDSLTAMEGSTVSLSGGSFGKIVGSGVTLKELLAKDCYYAELNGETPKDYADTDTVIEGVSVKLCDHTSVRENKQGYFPVYTCNCGKVRYLLTVTDGSGSVTYHSDYSKGFAYAAKCSGVVRLLEKWPDDQTITMDAQGTVAIDMSGNSLIGKADLIIADGTTLQIFSDGAYGWDSQFPARTITVRSGGKFILPAKGPSGGDNKLEITGAVTVEAGAQAELSGGYCRVYLWGEARISGGKYGRIDVRGTENKLTVTGGEIGGLELWGEIQNVKLSGGSVERLWVSEMDPDTFQNNRTVTFEDIQSLLADGKAFRKADNTWLTEGDVKEKTPFPGGGTVKELPDVTIADVPMTGAAVYCQLGAHTYEDTVSTQYNVGEMDSSGNVVFRLGVRTQPQEIQSGVTVQWYQLGAEDSRTPVGTGLTCPLDTKLPVGTHRFLAVVNCSGYILESQPFAVTITPRVVNITGGFTAQDRDYGPDETTVTITKGNVTFDKKAEGDDLGAQVSGGTVATPEAGQNKAVTYSATLTGEDKDNYTLGSVPDLTVTIRPIAQTLAFAEAAVTKTYGDSPFVNALTHSAGDGQITYTSSDPAVATVGTDGTVTIRGAGEARITATAAATQNYVETAASFDLTVAKATGTVRNRNYSLGYLYGDDIPTPERKYFEASSTGAFRYSWSPAAPKNAGNYQLTVTVDEDGNYTSATLVLDVLVEKDVWVRPTLVKAENETVDGKKDGKVTYTDTPALEYRLKRTRGEWIPVAVPAGEESVTVEGLAPETYEFRRPGDENHFASSPETITIQPGPKLTLTLPSPQTGYTLTASKTQLGWHEDVELSFQLDSVGAYKAADFGIWAEAGSEKTKLTLGNDGAVKLTAPEKDITITVTGVKTDNVAPQASIRGRLRKDSGYYVKWEGFQENPTDDFVNGDFVISATDRVSGVADFWYYLSDKPLTLEELKGMNGAFWARPANQGRVSITEDGVYYLYAKALDKANNAGYACTGKLVKESNPPTFSGVENEKTYYVSQQMEIHDDGMPDWYRAEGSIGVVPNGGNENPVKLQLPNNGSSYTFTVGDRCGNEATITVYMKPLSDLTQPLDRIQEETIRKSDRATLDDVEATLKGLDVTYATEPEKKEINDALARIAQLRQVLDQVAAVEAQIDALPDSVEPYQQTVEDTQIKPARDAYNSLTDHQKTLVDSTKLDKLVRLEAQLNAWTITEGDGQTWYKGSWNPLSFTVNGQRRKFGGIRQGNTYIGCGVSSVLTASGEMDKPFTLTLKPAFLQCQTPGEHSFTVYYSGDLSISVTYTVETPTNYLDVTDREEFEGKTTVTVDGKEYPIEEMAGYLQRIPTQRYVNLPETGDLLTIYSFKDGTPAGSYTNYPTGMQVFRITRQEGGAKAEEITEFANLLNYAGCSIRLTGTKGIRMITGIGENARTALTGARGLGGYTLEEYGTVVMRGVGTPTLENSNSHNFAYKKGKADPVFARAGGMIQYTNVLVGFSLEDCKDTLTLRPYIKLKDMTTGETVTLYGGCVSRSIGYIAKQNENTYQPDTAGYKYVHEIIDAVYGKTEQGGETK